MKDGTMTDGTWSEGNSPRYSAHLDTLVIGGGIAGIQAALEIANAGFKVYLVERTATIGGHMAMSIAPRAFSRRRWSRWGNIPTSSC
jgi:heterodisulfide reductase subunit A-like polyferredoxin